jgi:hypothetical protein
VPDGMPVVSATFPPGEDVGSMPVPIGLNICPEHWQWRTAELFCSLFEELKNIENRVAWFLAELCKAKQGVQKDERN